MVRSDIKALDHVASDALIKCVKLVFDLDFFDLLVDGVDENCSHKKLSDFRPKPHAPFVWHTMPWIAVIAICNRSETNVRKITDTT